MTLFHTVWRMLTFATNEREVKFFENAEFTKPFSIVYSYFGVLYVLYIYMFEKINFVFIIWFSITVKLLY